MTTAEIKMLDDLLNNDPDKSGNRLPDWELNFVEDLHRTKREGDLSEKQANKLQALWYRIC